VPALRDGSRPEDGTSGAEKDRRASSRGDCCASRCNVAARVVWRLCAVVERLELRAPLCCRAAFLSGCRAALRHGCCCCGCCLLAAARLYAVLYRGCDMAATAAARRRRQGNDAKQRVSASTCVPLFISPLFTLSYYAGASPFFCANALAAAISALAAFTVTRVRKERGL